VFESTASDDIIQCIDGSLSTETRSLSGGILVLQKFIKKYFSFNNNIVQSHSILCLKVHHSMTSYNAYMDPYLRRLNLYEVAFMGDCHLDEALVTTLVERWRLENSTFTNQNVLAVKSDQETRIVCLNWLVTLMCCTLFRETVVYFIVLDFIFYYFTLNWFLLFIILNLATTILNY
jgi:hypothetical protein